MSKFELKESIPYANFFWGARNAKTIQDYKIASKFHKSRNPHHPEYWMNQNGETNDMPSTYIVEMICDWWSFGLSKNDPTKIFDFYKNNKNKYKFSEELTNKIEKLLLIIKKLINELDNNELDP